MIRKAYQCCPKRSTNAPATSGNKIVFFSRSGKLIVSKDRDLLSMDFPLQLPKPCSMPDDLLEGLKREPLEILSSKDYVVIFSKEKDIRGLNPDFGRLRKLGLRGVIVTAKGDDADFVSRFFAPKYGIEEDPVTGSAHCALIPYWAKKLNKDTLYAQQVSKRGGELYCKNRKDSVVISGRAVKYMEGIITL